MGGGENGDGILERGISRFYWQLVEGEGVEEQDGRGGGVQEVGNVGGVPWGTGRGEGQGHMGLVQRYMGIVSGGS